MAFWDDIWNSPVTDVGLGLATGGLFNVGKFAMGGYGKGPGTFHETFFGSENTPGLLGTGQFGPKGHQVDPNAANLDRYSDWQGRLDSGAAAAAQRQAPMAQAAQLGSASLYGGATIDPTQQAQFRQGQLGLANQLWGQATGQGPSIADAQLRQASDRNMAQAMALGASQRGGARAGALRDIANQRASISQQLAADSGLLRLQEQQQAQGLLGNVLGAGRGQDIGLASAQAGLQQQAGLANQAALNQFALQQGAFNQQTNLANQQAGLQQTAMNDQLVRFYTQAGMDLATAQQRARMDMQQMMVNQNLGLEGLRAGAYANRAAANQAIVGALAQGAAGMAGGSGAAGAAKAAGGAPLGGYPSSFAPPAGY